MVHVSQFVPALVVHGCITFANIGQPAFTCEWLLPMLALAAKTSGCMLSAVKQQMQDAVHEVKQKGTSWTLLLISDWAKANRRLFREMVKLLPPLRISVGRRKFTETPDIYGHASDVRKVYAFFGFGRRCLWKSASDLVASADFP